MQQKICRRSLNFEFIKAICKTCVILRLFVNSNGIKFGVKFVAERTPHFHYKLLLWEPYPSYNNGLFSPLLGQRFHCEKSRSLSVLYKQYETSYLFYVTLSFLCNIICYLISVFVLSLVTLSGAKTVIQEAYLKLFQMSNSW